MPSFIISKQDMYQSASSGFTQEKGCFPKNMPSVFWWEKHWFWETYPTYFPKEWRIAPNLEDTGSVTVSHIHFRKVRCLTRTIVDREGIQYVYFWLFIDHVFFLIYSNLFMYMYVFKFICSSNFILINCLCVFFIQIWHLVSSLQILYIYLIYT